MAAHPMEEFLMVFLTVLAALICGEVQPPAPEWVPRLVLAEEAAEGFFPLFNGSDLDGWTVSGRHKSVFSVQDDILKVAGQPEGGWLVTAEPYENFVLRYSFRMLDKMDASVIGYGIGADGRPMTEQVLTATACPPDRQPMEWNEAEVICRGDEVRMFIDGAPWGDGPAGPGRIGIRDCGRMQFRNMRIKPLPGGAGWRRWDGSAGGLLPESFDLQFRFKPSAGSRGGVAFGLADTPLFTVRVDNHHPEEFTGSLAGKAGALELRAFDGRWNHMRIAVEGSNVCVWLNGKTVVDFVNTNNFSCAGAAVKFTVEHGLIEFEDIEMKPKESHHGA